MSLPHLGSAVGWIINRNEKEIEIKVEKVAAIREMGTQTKFSSLQANIPQMLSKIRFLLFKHLDNSCFCLFINTKFLTAFCWTSGPWIFEKICSPSCLKRMLRYNFNLETCTLISSVPRMWSCGAMARIIMGIIKLHQPPLGKLSKTF